MKERFQIHDVPFGFDVTCGRMVVVIVVTMMNNLFGVSLTYCIISRKLVKTCENMSWNNPCEIYDV